MTLADFLNNYVSPAAYYIIHLNTRHVKFDTCEEFANIVKLSITIYNICIIFLSILGLINYIFSLLFKTYKSALRLLQYFNLLVLSTTLGLLLFKFYVTLKLENALGIYFYSAKLDFYHYNKNLSYLEHFTVFSSSFSDAILILSFFIGLICLELLSQKNLLKTIHNLTIFFFFNVFVAIMVSTNNLLIMFISFEFIFLPTIFFAYVLGYTKKIDIAVEYLIL